MSEARAPAQEFKRHARNAAVWRGRALRLRAYASYVSDGTVPEEEARDIREEADRLDRRADEADAEATRILTGDSGH